MKKYAFLILGFLSAPTISFIHAADIVVTPPSTPTSTMLDIGDPTNIIANIIAYAIAIA